VLQTSEFQDERAELQTVLDSGIFNRAPHLHSFLSYICERYFEGEAAQLKEYTIAVEALRRQHGFDPKKDSIVRVEAHRLRKRLAEYYSTSGRDHRVRIAIPNGQYVPQFIPRTPTTNAVAEGNVPVLDNFVEPLPDSMTRRAFPAIAINPSIGHRRWLWLTPFLAVCLLGAAVLWRASSSAPTFASSNGNETWLGASTQPVPAEFRMIAGYHGPPIVDRQGHTWSPDSYFSGGISSPVSPDRPIQGEPDSKLLRTQRTGEFHYDIPVAKATYELRLSFAETDYGLGNALGGSETSRLFTVSINGADVIRRFDPLAEAGGPNRLLVRVFKDVSPAKDGKLHITFGRFEYAGRAVSPAFVNAIEILQSKPGRIHPVRIVTQDRALTDVDGKSWSSDHYFFGGTLAFHDKPVFTARDETLYRGERYGNFAYHIPLAPGKYRVTLHFAETWFGNPESNEPGPDSRRFNVFANGAALLQNFDIAREAGVNHEITKVFDDLQPNAQGALWLEFVPIENYALVNAIEVEEME
jgi:Malectin domain